MRVAIRQAQRLLHPMNLIRISIVVDLAPINDGVRDNPLPCAELSGHSVIKPLFDRCTSCGFDVFLVAKTRDS